MYTKKITKDELKKFLEANGCAVKVRKNWEDDKEISYTYEGYMGGRLIFDTNEFYVPKTVKLDALNSDPLELADTLNHNWWIYKLFILSEGTCPLNGYICKNFKFDRAGLAEI